MDAFQPAPLVYPSGLHQRRPHNLPARVAPQAPAQPTNHRSSTWTTQQSQHAFTNQGGGELCFPGDTVVVLADGTDVLISELSIGDNIVVPSACGSKTSEVYAFGHRDPDASAVFCVLDTDSGHSVALSAEHLIHIEGKGMIPAGDVAVGNIVLVVMPGAKTTTPAVRARVTGAREEKRAGIFAPMTLEGSLFANGVAVSCYAVLHHHALFHLAMAPVRALYRISKTTATLAHALPSFRLKGAHIYIDFASVLSPLVRLLSL
mmetsp:Transcript_117813/g.293807  ORF Transcript_117813/g.293807 Transcript_117813/m.293807 type:complete len:262 (+) Transcript_117813:446-1231(+)